MGSIRRSVETHSIGEMAIVWGLLVAISGMAAVYAAFILNESTGLRQDVILYGCLGLWLGLVCLVWIEFVRAGRQNAADRVSANDLTRLQLLAYGIIFADMVLLSPRNEWGTWQAVGLTLEWTIIVFHVIYFSLAWGMRAPVPARTYLLALVMLGMVILGTPFDTVGSGSARLASGAVARWHRRG